MAAGSRKALMKSCVSRTYLRACPVLLDIRAILLLHDKTCREACVATRVLITRSSHVGHWAGSGASYVSSTRAGAWRQAFGPYDRPAFRPGGRGSVFSGFANGAACRDPARRAASSCCFSRAFSRRNRPCSRSSRSTSRCSRSISRSLSVNVSCGPSESVGGSARSGTRLLCQISETSTKDEIVVAPPSPANQLRIR